MTSIRQWVFDPNRKLDELRLFARVHRLDEEGDVKTLQERARAWYEDHQAPPTQEA
jgi:hypothetical protein